MKVSSSWTRRRRGCGLAFGRVQPAAGEIEAEAVEATVLVVPGRAALGAHPAQRVAGPGDQLPGIERLGDIVVATALQTGEAVDLLPAARHQDDPDVRMRADLPGQGEAVRPRQLDVQQQLGAGRLDPSGEALAVLLGVDVEAGLLEVGRELSAGDGFVLDDDHVGSICHGCGTCHFGPGRVIPSRMLAGSTGPLGIGALLW